MDVDGCGESDDSGMVSSNDVDGTSFDWVVSGREMGTVFSVRSQGGIDERNEDAKSEAQVLDSVVSEIKDTDVKDAERDDIVNEETRDVDSEISLTVQTSVLGVSSSEGTAINGVDFGVSVSVHIFCSCVAWSVG